MSIRVKFQDPDAVLNRLGMKPGGNTHKFFMRRAADRMKKYLPYRDKGSVKDALEQGMDTQNAQFILRGPHHAYLYFGKAMAGKPRKPTSKDLVYTKSPNAQAGPFYDKRMMQNEGKALAAEITEHQRRK